MSGGRITRRQAQLNLELQNEIEAYNPLGGRELINLERDSSTTETESPDNTSSPRIEESDGQVRRESETETASEIDEFEDTIVDLANVRMDGENQVRYQGVNPGHYISIKDAVSIIPEFDGTNIPVSHFTDECEEAKAMVDVAALPNLVKLARTRLRGDAKRAIQGQTFENMEELVDLIKGLFADMKSINQLQGELGSQFQREGESVVTYANRLRDLGKQILETKKFENGTIDDAFKSGIETSLVECLKRGLLPEIETRVEEADEISTFLKNAIKTERAIQAQRTLTGNAPVLGTGRGIAVKQICAIEETKVSQEQICKKCGRRGHREEQCFGGMQCFQCGKTAHIAKFCRVNSLCQLCGKPGHQADTCYRFTRAADGGKNGGVTCQLCNQPGHTANNCFRINQGYNTTESRVTCQL